MRRGETIAAVSTAPGRAGVAVVRVSGDGAFALAHALTGRAVAPGRIGVARVRGEMCVILAFKAPHSYTGEDVVEVQCHGGAIAPQRILAACFDAGARLARPGEFTERAFLNGRLSLDEAEAVIDLIDAKTERAAEAALSGLDGTRDKALRALYDEALDLSSTLEHALDVDESDLPDGFERQMASRLDELAGQIDAARRRLREGALLHEGALVVLAGPPNAGKSSLLNALLGENRAIVSPTAGTTRDAIEAWADFGGWPVRLVDTAGLRETSDSVEAEGVARAEALVARADVVVALGGARGTIAVHAKCDLGHGPGLNVSAVTGEGLDDLKRAIVAALEEKVAQGGALAEAAGERRRQIDSALAAARAALAEGAPHARDLVLLGNAARRVAGILGELIGAEYSADLLDRLFSRFCVGK